MSSIDWGWEFRGGRKFGVGGVGIPERKKHYGGIWLIKLISKRNNSLILMNDFSQNSYQFSSCHFIFIVARKLLHQRINYTFKVSFLSSFLCNSKLSQNFSLQNQYFIYNINSKQQKSRHVTTKKVFLGGLTSHPSCLRIDIKQH